MFRRMFKVMSIAPLTEPLLRFFPLVSRRTGFRLWRLSLKPFGQGFVLAILSLRGDQIRVVVFESLHH